MIHSYRTQIKEWLLRFHEKNKHLYILTYFFIYLIWFRYVEETVTTHFHVVHVTLDDYIPFCEYFIIPYLLWFAYVAWGIIYAARHNRQDYYRLCAFLFTGMTIFLIVSTLYPNGHYLRPQYFTHHNVFTSLCEWLWAADTPTNLFPSIHVYNSIAVHLFVTQSKELKNNRTVRFLSFTLMASIILATMFLKQHSAFDVATAFLLAYIMYHIIYRHNWTKASATQKSRGKVKLSQ